MLGNAKLGVGEELLLQVERGLSLLIKNIINYLKGAISTTNMKKKIARLMLQMCCEIDYKCAMSI